MGVSKALDQAVRARAGDRCEYCRVPQSISKLRFWIDHVVASQHGGVTQTGNLALACPFCNRHKGPNVAGFDPVSNALTPLYNPRQDDWRSHFAWVGDEILGLTPEGRATVQVLAMNHPLQTRLRRMLFTEGLLPPEK